MRDEVTSARTRKHWKPELFFNVIVPDYSQCLSGLIWATVIVALWDVCLWRCNDQCLDITGGRTDLRPWMYIIQPGSRRWSHPRKYNLTHRCFNRTKPAVCPSSAEKRRCLPSRGQSLGSRRCRQKSIGWRGTEAQSRRCNIRREATVLHKLHKL